ncbi:MAG: hypothetical protein ABI330_19545 [Caldimonas sp.]
MRMTKLFVVLLVSAAATGCIVVPATRPVYEAPAGVVYVAPTYASPGPGWRWAYHARYGWGWHHRDYGWHRGWR